MKLSFIIVYENILVVSKKGNEYWKRIGKKYINEKLLARKDNLHAGFMIFEQTKTPPTQLFRKRRFGMQQDIRVVASQTALRFILHTLSLNCSKIK